MVWMLSTVWILALAVSLDSFGVGISYGIRRIRLPWLSITVIAGCSALSMRLAMGLGSYFAQHFSTQIANSIGAGLLIAVGCWVLWQARSKPASPSHRGVLDVQKVQGEQTVWKLELRKIGIVIQILRKPAMADMDRSGTITAGEALLLGTALALDAFAAGIGAGLTGYPVWATSCAVGVLSGGCLYMGQKLGKPLARRRIAKKLTWLPGVLLIVLGAIRLL